MLKITTHTEKHSTTFQLEGRLAGPWVEELRRCWRSAVKPDDWSFYLDLSGVTYVDAGGKDLLKTLHQDGVILIASGCLMNCLVGEITQGAAGGRNECKRNS